MSLVLGSTYQKVFAKMLQPSANPWFLNQFKSIKILDHKDFLFVLKSNITSLHALSPTLRLRLPVLQDNWPFYAALKNAIKTLFCHLGSVSPFMGVGEVEWGPCVCIRGEGRLERKVVVVVQVVSGALVLMRCAYPGLPPPGCALPRSLRPGDICTQRCFASRRAKQKSFRHCSHVLGLFRGFLHDHTSSQPLFPPLIVLAEYLGSPHVPAMLGRPQKVYEVHGMLFLRKTLQPCVGAQLRQQAILIEPPF